MNKPHAIALLVTVLGLAAAGCATKPIDQYYTLNFPPPSFEGGARTDLVLKVRTFRTGEVYRQERIVRRFEENRITYYDTHRWAAPVERMVTEQAIEVLRASGLFAQVLPYSSATRGDLVLEGEVLAIEERIEGNERTAVIHLRARVTKRESGDLLWEAEAHWDHPVEGTRPENTVRALNLALREALLKLTEHLGRNVEN